MLGLSNDEFRSELPKYYHSLIITISCTPNFYYILVCILNANIIKPFVWKKRLRVVSAKCNCSISVKFSLLLSAVMENENIDI